MNKNKMNKKLIFPFLLILLAIIFLYIFLNTDSKKIEKDTVINANTILLKDKAYIGEEISLTTKITYRNDIEYSFEDISFDSNYNKSRILYSNSTVKNINNFIENTIEYKIAFYDTGKFNISGFTINYKFNNLSETIYGEDMTIDIISFSDGNILPATKKAIKLKTPTLFFIIIACLIILIAIIIIFVIFIKRKKKKIVLIYEDKEAIKKLKKLKSKKYIENGDYTSYYFTLTEIFKIYISIRFNEKITEMTTNEFRKRIEELKIEDKKDILAFFDFADYVKFAKLIPNNEECEKHFDLCKNYINKLKSKN